MNELFGFLLFGLWVETFTHHSNNGFMIDGSSKEEKCFKPIYFSLFVKLPVFDFKS